QFLSDPVDRVVHQVRTSAARTERHTTCSVQVGASESFWGRSVKRYILAGRCDHEDPNLAHLPSDRTITVSWTKFLTVYDPMSDPLWHSEEAWQNSVYVIADSMGGPLYIGKATGRKNPGFG